MRGNVSSKWLRLSPGLPPPVVPITFTPVANWTILDDHFMSQILRDRLPLRGVSPTMSTPLQTVYPAKQLTTQQVTIGTLISKHAPECLGPSSRTPGLYLPIFLVAKNDCKKFRMIFNMKLFNVWYLEITAHFACLSCSFAPSFDKGNTVWLDLQHAYLHIPIHREHRHYLRFIFQGRHYQ